MKSVITTTESMAAELWSEIRDPETPPPRLQGIWNARFQHKLVWEQAPVEIYEIYARRMLGSGAPLLALEAASKGLDLVSHSPKSNSNSLLLRQLKGLGLARTGDVEQAQKVITEVWAELRNDSQVSKPLLQETLGLLARLSKDRGLALTDETERLEILTQACNAYGEAYNATDGYWTGINEASLATLTGDHARANRVAKKVRDQCLQKKTQDSQEDLYWLLATLGEAELNLGNVPAAEANYREAGRLGMQRIGDLNSTRRQTRLLLQHFGLDQTLVDSWLPIPRVVVFAGHMFDCPGRNPERFPLRLEQAVKQSIKDWLQGNRVLIGFSSAANGADILFQEALYELGGEANVILPYEAEEFIADSVSILGPDQDPQWVARARTVVDRAARVVRASSTRLYLDSDSYVFANEVINGLAMIRARELETPLLGLAVSDGQATKARGGTASMIKRWHDLKIPVARVDLSKLPSDVPAQIPVVPMAVLPEELETEAGVTAPPSETTVMALLFADAQGFSGLTDSEVPLFVKLFLGRIAEMVEQHQDAIDVRETWGDGLFLAFKSVQAAGSFALKLSRLVNDTDWTKHGFHDQLRLRTALHAGPVYRCTDPVTGLRKCCGTHVSQAARLEPATPADQVYASEAFAALAELERAKDFHCHYVKQLPWGKDYGTFPAYVVHRAIL